MSIGNSRTSSLKNYLQAAVFAVVVVGGLSLGLGVTTYTVAKANDLVFGLTLSTSASAPAGKRCIVD